MIIKKYLELKVSEHKETNEHYNFNCFVCGDNKYHGYIYKNDYQYHCFKCEFHSNVLELFDSISETDYIEILKIVNKSYLYKFDDYLKTELNDFGIDIETFCKHYNLKTVLDDLRPMRFLKSNEMLYSIDNFLYNSKNKHIYLLNLTTDNKVIGYTIFNLLNFGKPEKYTSLSTIYKELKINIIIPDYINRLSLMQNICNIDKNNIILFDDILNSMLYENSLYSISNNHIFNKPRFMYANNEHGLQRFNENKSCTFDWKSFLKNNELQTKKIYDLLDLQKRMNKTGEHYTLENYFYGI